MSFFRLTLLIKLLHFHTRSLFSAFVGISFLCGSRSHAYIVYTSFSYPCRSGPCFTAAVLKASQRGRHVPIAGPIVYGDTSPVLS
jgi:hypothetical protein